MSTKLEWFCVELKYLELNGYANVALTEKFIRELQFPCLETLSIAIGLYKEVSTKFCYLTCTGMEAISESVKTIFLFLLSLAI
jgi:hypothetical protein